MTIKYFNDIDGHSVVSIGLSSFMYFSDTLEKNTCVLEAPRELRLAIYRLLQKDNAKALVSFDAEQKTLTLIVGSVVTRETCFAIFPELDHARLRSKVLLALILTGGTDSTSVPKTDTEIPIQLNLVSHIKTDGPAPVLAPAVFTPHARVP